MKSKAILLVKGFFFLIFAFHSFAKGIWSDSTVVDLGYPASTICTNRDATRIAVAGRKCKFL